jgi:hypothetical protein
MGRGVRRVRLKSGDSGLCRKPLSKTTIQEKGLPDNRVSLRKAGLFSEKDDGMGLFIPARAVVIFAVVLCSARAA